MKNIFVSTCLLFSASLFSQSGCAELFFSEYAEGSSNHKYFEIYNPTANAVSLSGYTVYLSGNGGSFTNSYSPSGSLASGDVYVVSTNQANSVILAEADTAMAFPSVAHFNGDDALILVNGTDTIDVIGVPGVDPGSSWTVGTGSTQNHTLVRKATITGGSTNWTSGAGEWDVYASNTWTYVGAHSSNCIYITPTPTFDSIVAISTITGLDASGVADSLGASKWIKGIVTTIDFDGNGGYSFYLSDSTDGINIYNYADQSGYTSPMMGDSLILHGDVAQFKGLTELFVDSIYYIAGGYTVPTPTVVTSLGESTESELVKLSGFTLVNASQWPSTGSSANVDIRNGTDTLTMRIDSDTDIDGSPAPAGYFDVTGVGSQFDNSSPYTEGYQILPRMLTDIFEHPFIPTYTIGAVTGLDVDGVADSIGVTCKVVGTVLGVDMIGSSTAIGFTIHDGTDGINVYSSVPAVQSYSVTEGDQIRLIGTISQFNGLTQINPDSIAFISSNNTLPTPTIVAQLGENTESEIVTFTNATLVNPSQWGSGSSGYNIDITNGTDTIEMRIDADTDIYGTAAPTGAFDVTGIGGQYDWSSPYTSGYQLLPRYQADITSPQPLQLVVSEIMPRSNMSSWNADWFEIYNYGDTAVDLAGMSWDDESGNSGTSTFPSVIIAPGEAVIVWDDSTSNENSFMSSWNLYPGSVQIISIDELSGSFPSLSQNGDGVYLFDAAGNEFTKSLYNWATQGYSIEFDSTGSYIGNSVDSVNGAYSNWPWAAGNSDVGSPGVGRYTPFVSNWTAFFCSGDTIQIGFITSFSQSYLWNTGDTTNIIDVYQGGNYSVIITTSEGLIDTISIMIDEGIVDTSLTISGALDFCYGSSVTLTCAAGHYLNWNTGQSGSSITISQSGNYYAVVTGPTGCTDTTATYTTSILPSPNTAVTSSGALNFCSNESVTLSAAAGHSYQWSNGDTSQNITIAQAGSYYATVTNIFGCSGTTNTYVTTVFADPDTSVTTSGSLNLCSGESVTLTAASGQNYLWSTGATAQSITTGQAGTYFAIITTADGCVDTTASYVVTVSPLPNVSIVAPQLALCSGQTVTLSTQNTYSSYLWGGDSTGTQDTLVVTPGTYWLSVINSSGCINSDTITILELTPYTTQPEVCIVTNDPSTGFNKIIWERSSKQGVEYYNVYRNDVIGYTKVGSKGVNQISQLTDNSSNPGLQAYKYYITITDSCGAEYGSNSLEHSTIHLQSSIGTSGEVNLLWTSYLGRTPLYYRISRKGVNDSVYTVIDSVNLTNNTYTDLNTLTGFTKYQVSAVMGSGCNSSNKSGVTSSLSNVTTENTISINENGSASIAISPNPNSGYFNVSIDPQYVGSVYHIIDNRGRLVVEGILSEQTQKFDLSRQPKGVYVFQVLNENLVKTITLVIQ